jgi:hypothetical protein
MFVIFPKGELDDIESIYFTAWVKKRTINDDLIVENWWGRRYISVRFRYG